MGFEFHNMSRPSPKNCKAYKSPVTQKGHWKGRSCYTVYYLDKMGSAQRNGLVIRVKFKLISKLIVYK